MNAKLNALLDAQVGEDVGQMLPGGVDGGWVETSATRNLWASLGGYTKQNGFVIQVSAGINHQVFIQKMILGMIKTCDAHFLVKLLFCAIIVRHRLHPEVLEFPLSATT